MIYLFRVPQVSVSTQLSIHVIILPVAEAAVDTFIGAELVGNLNVVVVSSDIVVNGVDLIVDFSLLVVDNFAPSV